MTINTTQLTLYNSRTNLIEPFTEQEDGVVTLYVCGITPYDTTHLGHAFTYLTADLLIRYLEMQGKTVHYVQNVTDIDDDILRKASEVDEPWWQLGDRWTHHFIEDLTVLNVRPPDHFPRATEVINEIIASVQRLQETGLAYASGGNVYFDVDAYPAFGRLSGIAQEEMLPIANERGNHPDDPHKRQPLDFVLWQAQAEGEPAWSSPWGNGRPGWHIECSVMASHFLGDTIDIHCGGSDLLFPHHECEIAQIEPVTGKRPFVNVWFHTAMVEHEGEKMSKSLGNLVMMRDLLERYSPDALRLYLAQHHYREAWSHDELELKKAVEWVMKLETAVTALNTGNTMLDPIPAYNRFVAEMNKDLNSSGAIAAMLNLADEIIFRAPNGYNVHNAILMLQKMATVFGLRLGEEQAEDRVIAGWHTHLQKFLPKKELTV